MKNNMINKQSEIHARCNKICKVHYGNTLYNNLDIVDCYLPNGPANKARSISHYCSCDVLRSILNNRCLRFSDVRFLNDATEFVEIIPIINHVLDKGKYENAFKKLIQESDEMRQLESYVQSYTGRIRSTGSHETVSYRTYTCSFSGDGDALGLWNSYTLPGDGVSIRFKHAKDIFGVCRKAESADVEKLGNNIIARRGPVIYRDKDKEKCIRRLFEDLNNVFQVAAEDIDKFKNLILASFVDAVNNLRCFFKNEAFEFEKEYRIVLNVPENLLRFDVNSDEFKTGQFKRGNILIPYIDFPINIKSIKKIVLNPIMKEQDGMFELGIKELLWQNKMEDVKVYKSRIPLRKYY